MKHAALLTCQTFLLGAFAFAADTPASALLVLNKSENRLAILDPQTHQVVARIPTGDQPHELTVSSDGRFAFASNYGAGPGGNTISVIDLAAQTARLVPLEGLARPHGMWFHAGMVYFTAEANQALARYDPAAGKIDWTWKTGQNGTHMVSVSRDGNRVFATNIGSGTVTILDRAGAGWNSTLVNVGRGPEGFDVSPDGRELWAAHSQDGGISIIDLASKQVTRTIPNVTRRSNRLKFTPDGKLVLVSDASTGELVVLEAPARKEVKRVKLGSAAVGVLIAPGGARAYVALQSDNAVAIFDLKTLEPAGRIDMGPGSGPDGLAWAGRPGN